MNRERLGRVGSILRASWRDGGPIGTAKVGMSYIRWRMKPDRVQRQLRALRKEPWLPVLMRAQSTVWDSGEDYYRARYQTDEVHYWTRVAGWLYEYSQAKGPATSFDVGSGFGTLAVFLTEIFGRTAIASDMHRRDGVDLLAERGLLEFHRWNLELDEEAPITGPFDVVVFTEVLEHLNFDPVPTLRKLRDLLADDGRLFLSTPDAEEWGRVTKFYRSMTEMPSPEEGRRLVERGEWAYIDDHVWQYSRDELEDVIARAGFEVVRFGYAPGVAYRHFNLELVKG